MSYRDYYENAPWPGICESEVVRFAAVADHIPTGITSILEVGCGDGRLSSHLPSPSQNLTCTDLSGNALRHFRRPNTRRVQASVDFLPFADKSFDVVVCSEVLEHLPDPVFEQARVEIARVALRFALLTVPYRENLRAEAYGCSKCGRVYHAYGHLRSFRRSTMTELLPGFRASKVWTFGPAPKWLWPMALLRTPRLGSRCDSCGHETAPGSLSLAQKALDWLNTSCVAPWYRRDYWIGAVYKRVADPRAAKRSDRDRVS